MLVRMSFTITTTIFGAGLIYFFMFGCSAAAPLYVIDVQKLAGATPETANQLLKKMVSCNLMHEDRWEEGQGDVEDIIGKLDSRVYEIENGQIDRWERKPRVTLNFDPYYEERVNGLDLHFIEYVDSIDVLRRLGYDPDKRIKHINDTNGWYFITTEWLHQAHLMDTGQSTAVSIRLDALTH